MAMRLAMQFVHDKSVLHGFYGVLGWITSLPQPRLFLQKIPALTAVRPANALV